MADKKITELTNITGANLADADEFVVVDSSASETKAITWAELKSGLDTSTGFVRVTGDTMTGNLNLGDNNQAIFGAGSDLRIYHNGSDSYIEDLGTGNLYIRGSSLTSLGSANGEYGVLVYENGTTALRYDNSQKLQTTSTGVDVTGTVTASDSVQIDSGGTGFFVGGGATGTTAIGKLHNSSGLLTLDTDSTRSIKLATGTTQRLRIDGSTGDISFYEDTGTTPKFFWDASAEALGIGTTSIDVNALLEVSSSDNKYIRAKSTGVDSTTGYVIANDAQTWVIRGNGTNGDALEFRNATAGRQEMVISTAGNVGIGTSAPSAALDVTSTGTRGARITRSLVSPSNGTYALEVDNTAQTANVTAAGALKVTNNNGSGLLIDGKGDVSLYDDSGSAKFFWDASAEALGIGTVAPANPLHIFSAGLARIRLESTGSNADIAYYGPSGTLYGVTGYSATKGGLDIDYRTSNLTFSFSGSERMRISSSGNVGIGTSSPSGKLHVVGGRSYLQTSSGDQYVLKLTNPANADGVWLGTPAADSFAVYTAAGSERMRIDASGNLLVGTTSNGAKLAVVSSVNQTKVYVEGYGSGVGRGIDMKAGVDSASAIVFNNSSGTSVGSITQTTTATAYNTSSDYRLKEDVQPMVGASDRVLSLNPVNFAWKADGSRTDGFIAHEVQEVAPYAVTGEKDGEDMQAMDHSKLVPLLTAALQEALTEIANLKARVAALEA